MSERTQNGTARRADEREFATWLSSFTTMGTVTIRADLVPAGGSPAPDALVTAEWRGGRATFAAEFRPQSNPGTVDVAILQARRAAESTGHLPMVIVPYLSEARLQELESQGVSGLDMSGNGIILADGFRVWQSGRPNRYRDTATIRNPLGGDSSIFARCFALRGEFASLTSLRDFAVSRTLLPGAMGQAPLRLGTASKVVKRLRDERLVGKSGLHLRLEDPRGLMAALRDGYSPVSDRRLVGKTTLTRDAIWHRLAGARTKSGLRAAATGLGSAGVHGVLFGIEQLGLYVDDLATAADLLEFRDGRAFANMILIETRRHVPYFDLYPDGEALWASPIQTWLELAHEGPREREAAEAMERRLIDALGARAR